MRWWSSLNHATSLAPSSASAGPDRGAEAWDGQPPLRGKLQQHEHAEAEQQRGDDADPDREALLLRAAGRRCRGGVRRAEVSPEVRRWRVRIRLSCAPERVGL